MPPETKPRRVRVVAIEDNFDSIVEFADLIERTLAVKGISAEDIVNVAFDQRSLESPPGRRRLTALILARTEQPT